MIESPLATVSIPMNQEGFSSMNEPSTPSRSDDTTALIVLRPEEGRRLIGRAVAEMASVRERTRNGRMAIVGSSTTRHVVHHLTGADPGLTTFAVGWIRDGELGETPHSGRGPGPVLFDNGKIYRGWPGKLLESFEAGDIYVKGANAIDPQGNAAILIGSPGGGSIGAALTIIFARGGELILPVSLEKLIPSVPAACGLLGQGQVDRVMGSPVGYMPIMAGSATIVTEVTAMQLLAGVQATPIAAGGLDDCTGSQTLHLKGPKAGVEKIWNLITSMRQ